MINHIFHWKRFWCSRTGTISLNDNGFFFDPESEYAHYYHNGVVAFEEIQETPCLILLGEPGIGKTTTLKSEIDILTSQTIEKGDKLFYKNLNEYGDENRLICEIFESSTIKSWLKGTNRLYLFLDSLDECFLEIPKLAIILRNQFHKFKNHTNRLSLRISCRTADWPEILKDEFDTIWGGESVGVYELAPLRRKDVTEAAQFLGLDSSGFIEAIEKKEIQSLASNPITLNFILEEYKHKKQFSDTRSELFLRGCEHLCTETNPDRQATQQIGKLSTAKRLSLTSRIAALMIFCNRSAIYMHTNISDLKETDLTLQMVQEGEDTTADLTFGFTERDLREAVKYSALFSSRGPYRFGFVHQSYTEFLAARYLALHQLNIEQIKSLFLLSNDPDQMTIPQLRETMAWLCSIKPKVFQELIKSDPQSMLLSDIISFEPGLRRDLVESLLNKFEQQKIIDTDRRSYAQYQKLKHPGLESQLRPYIEDKAKHFLVRRVAIDIAETCGVESLQNLLTDVALDHLDDVHIREQATHAVSIIADDKTRLRLKPLAMEEQQEDKEDQLKGYSLCALWPGQLSAQEVFDILLPPKQENFFGSYAGFLMNIPDQLKKEDLPSALKWAKKNPGERTGYPHLLVKLTEKILFRAWSHLDNKEILDAYADAIIPRLANYLNICPPSKNGKEDQFPHSLSDDTRKNLIKAIIRKVKKHKKHKLASSMVRPQILFDNDLEWLIRELEAEKDQEIKKIWIETIHDIFDPLNTSHIDLISIAISEIKQLADKFQSYFDAVTIDSPQAVEERNSYEKNRKLEMELDQNEIGQKRTNSPPVYEKIKTCLERFESGNLDAWWQLCRKMTLEDNSNYCSSELISDLMALPGWKVCDDFLRDRIVKAGKKYLLEKDANTEHWLGKDIFYRPARAGYKAFIMLKKLDPEFLNNLSTDRWEKWASIIIGYTENSETEDEDNTSSEIIKQAYQNAPQEVIDTLLILIDKENEKYDSLFILCKIEDCLDKRLQDALLDKAKDVSLKPSCFQDLLSYLLRANSQEAKSYAESLLTLPLSKDSDSLERAKASALALLNTADDAGWDTVWAAIRSDTVFGKNVFMSLPNSSTLSKTKSLPDRIGEKNTADLFICLNKKFPRKDDPNQNGVHNVVPRESLAHYRDSLLRSLETKGTEEAIWAIEHIQNELPELEFLNFYLVKARENMRRTNWIPLSPEDFLSLSRNPSIRLIQNADNLLEALMESLKRLEKKLQGETPIAFSLWDKINNNKFKPKSENDFSDFVKAHLTDDLKQKGIIALREVEIRKSQGEGGRQGERTDIYVAGFVLLNKEHVRVTIEVKGCWHDEVNEAMETQLVNRYLNENNCNHGIYLVGWFSCNQWETSDTRKNKISAQNIEEARTKFNEQAMKLSSVNKKIKSFVMNCALP